MRAPKDTCHRNELHPHLRYSHCHQPEATNAVDLRRCWIVSGRKPPVAVGLTGTLESYIGVFEPYKRSFTKQSLSAVESYAISLRKRKSRTSTLISQQSSCDRYVPGKICECCRRFYNRRSNVNQFAVLCHHLMVIFPPCECVTLLLIILLI